MYGEAGGEDQWAVRKALAFKAIPLFSALGTVAGLRSPHPGGTSVWRNVGRTPASVGRCTA